MLTEPDRRHWPILNPRASSEGVVNSVTILLTIKRSSRRRNVACQARVKLGRAQDRVRPKVFFFFHRFWVDRGFDPSILASHTPEISANELAQRE
jgi:hypothetical protein